MFPFIILLGRDRVRVMFHLKHFLWSSALLHDSSSYSIQGRKGKRISLKYAFHYSDYSGII